MASSIILSSLLCKDAYPENNGGNFHNYLNQELHLDGGCKIALSEVIYEPNSWDNVREGSNDVKISMHFKPEIRIQIRIYYNEANYNKYDAEFGIFRIEGRLSGWHPITSFNPTNRLAYIKNVQASWTFLTEFNQKSSIVETDAIFRFENPVVFDGYIMQNQYITVKALMREIIRVVHEGIEAMIAKYNIYDVAGQAIEYDHADIKYQLKSHEGYWFWMDEVDGRVKMYVMTSWHSSSDFQIWFHPALQHILGLTDFPAHDIGWISFEGAAPSLIGKYYESVVWSNTVDGIDLMRNTFKSLWVYCDIIKPSFVASNMQPLLRLLPVKNDSNVISYEVMANLHHHRIIQNNVQTIHIWFTESHDGPPMKMYADSYIRLLFMRTPIDG
jgi:hypothetical protein